MKCGYHKVKITPPLGAPLLGQYQERLAKGVLDDLFVKAIAFDSQGKQAVAIELDVCLLTEATCTQFRKTIADYCKVSEDAILLICNHTHTGPMSVPDFASDKKPDPEYMAFLENAVRDAAYYALQDLKPARFFVAESQAKGISFIRRYRMKDGSAKTNPAPLDPNIDHPIGEPNETVKLLKIVREGGDDIFIINFGTHSDTTAQEKLYISADFSYYACEAIEAAIPGTQCAFFLAPQGDVNHRNPARADLGRVVSERENEDYKELCAHTRYMGRVIAGSVIAACDKATEINAEGIWFGTSYVDVPSHQENHRLEESYRIIEIFNEQGKEAIRQLYPSVNPSATISRARRVIRLKDGPASFSLKLSALRVGDYAFAGFSGEPFTGIRNRAEENSPFANTMVCALTNSSGGYIPTSADYDEEPSYEVRSSSYGPGTDDALVSGMTALLNTLK